MMMLILNKSESNRCHLLQHSSGTVNSLYISRSLQRLYLSKMRISSRLLSTFALLQLAFATSAYAQPKTATCKRVVYYFDTMFQDNDTFISLLPLISKENLNNQSKPFTTDVLVGAFHLGPELDRPNWTGIHLNGWAPNNSTYDTLWNETAVLQSKGININLFLGGYMDQSFVNLASNFSYYYPILKQTIETYKFNGIDLDVEDNRETTEQMETLINQLSSDFGRSFIITLAPVASDMNGGSGLSNIDYLKLFQNVGSKISWFNVQFYSGYGSLSSTSDYTAIINHGFPANVIVAGMLSNYNGNGFVNLTIVEQTVASLVLQFNNFGGVDAWEYYDSLPGGTANPAQWGTDFGKVMHGD